jgi:hypothetical protein
MNLTSLISGEEENEPGEKKRGAVGLPARALVGGPRPPTRLILD